MNVLKTTTALVFGGIVFAGAGCQLYLASADKHFADVHISNKPDAADVTLHIVLGIPSTNDGSDGLAHYTEHLVWKSASQNSTQRADQHSNAWTSSIAMGYWLSGPRKELPNLLKTLSGVFDPISVSAEYAQQERDIVRREYDYRLLNNTDRQATVAMNQFLYKGNAIAASSIGTPQTIAKLDYNRAKAFHHATHVPANAVLVVVGAVDKQEVMQAIKVAGVPTLSAGQDGRDSSVQFKPAESESKDLVFNTSDTESHLVFRKVVALGKAVDFDTLAMQANELSNILEANLPGGLAGPLRYDHFIARSFSVDVFALDEQHIEIRFEATPDSGVSLKELHLAFEAALRESANGIPLSTYDRANARKDSSWPDWEDDDESANWMSSYVLRRVSGLREPLSSNELIKLKKRLSLNDLNTLLAALQTQGRQVVAFIGSDVGENK